MDSANSTLVLKALDCLSARATVTAQNIANANTPNYRPLRLSFEQALKNAAALGEQAVQQVSPAIERTNASGNGELRLDLELAAASGTATRYGALIDVLDRTFQLNSLAITGGS